MVWLTVFRRITNQLIEENSHSNLRTKGSIKDGNRYRNETEFFTDFLYFIFVIFTTGIGPNQYQGIKAKQNIRATNNNGFTLNGNYILRHHFIFFVNNLFHIRDKNN